MKKFNEYVSDELILSSEEIIDESPVLNPSAMNDIPPAVLVMRRVSVRQFPNGQNFALYYIDKINKYVTVPYSNSILQAEEKDQ